ncbi:EF-P lysine aminoacylase GenX [Candidatus Uhrbacteria bacterium]|nr:EF-P lysine aminoacylase GenX [Candidatus Uhrbacteria bacterium]
MNLENVKRRSQVIKRIRAFFDDQGFLEMHTPRLVALPGQEPHLDPLWTEVHSPSLQATSYKLQAGLITSPEYAMKRLLAEGLDKIYDLGSCFRDGEPWDGTHDPEFLLLEWYRRDAGLEELMKDTEEMIRYVASSLLITHYSLLSQPFRRLTVSEAMKQYANVDLEPLLDDREALAQVVIEHGQTVQPTDTWDDLFFKIFLSEVEPSLGWNDDRTAFQPTFLYNYPASMAALARKDSKDQRFALRTELYIGDLELANGFAELADPVEQRKRFQEERELRRSLGKNTWPLDERFLKALPSMGNAAGMAFGVDRLVMLLAGASSINDVIPFSAREKFVPEEE